ncbi:MAG: agmatinase [Desulfurispora sp.]|uniref:agmatinase n=1 Tax=Desulfurispora sp. TaxID=3014275 RepID=UPI00404A7DB7
MYLEQDCRFLAAGADPEPARLVIVGAPMDFTVSFRTGTREGPRHIRLVSAGLEEYSPELDRQLDEVAFADWGDVVMQPGRVAGSLGRIAEVLRPLYRAGKIPLLLGGEHLVSLPAIEEAARVYPDLAVLHFDAHADLRHEYLGETLSHATVMRRVCEIIGAGNLYQFGIRSGTREEFAFAREHCHLYRRCEAPQLQELVQRLAGRPVYISLDIDVLDPAFAPGTGTPEPGGIEPRTLFEALYQLAGLQVVGLDIVEVCPVYDPSGATSILAAKLVREAVLLWAPPR